MSPQEQWLEKGKSVLRLTSNFILWYRESLLKEDMSLFLGRGPLEWEVSPLAWATPLDEGILLMGGESLSFRGKYISFPICLLDSHALVGYVKFLLD